MLSTLLDADASIHENASVPMIWNDLDGALALCTNPVIILKFSADNFTAIPYVIEVYFVQCLLSANITQVAVDMRTNSLWNPMSTSQSPMQWETYQWTSVPNNTWQAQVGYTTLILGVMTLNHDVALPTQAWSGSWYPSR
jgi:hypothetical protein